ncbi:hypothetical protein K439DRAFT_1308123, partial [Ramaria rubella]
SEQHIRPAQRGQHITEKWLGRLSDGESLWHFRVTGKQLKLASVLMLLWFITSKRVHIFRCQSTCTALLCAQCCTAGDQFNLSGRYMRSQSAISGVMKWMVLYLDETWTHILKGEHEGLLTPN